MTSLWCISIINDVTICDFDPVLTFCCFHGFKDDVVMGMLTVKENIAFSAALRLPSSTPQDVRNRRVNDVITDLGLAKCADTKVGIPA